MRYPRDLRDNPQAIANDVLVPMPGGGAVPLREVAKVAAGAWADLDPNRERATGYLHLRRYPRPRSRRLCRRRAAGGVGQYPVPAGYYVIWSGQFEYLERATARLKIVVPVTLLIIFLLLYLNFRAI